MIKKKWCILLLFVILIVEHPICCMPNEYFNLKSREARNIFGPHTKFPFMVNTSNEYICNKAVTDVSEKSTLVKKWKVGRVSQKHFEIVNMLWRNTKKLVDTETITIKYQLSKNKTRNDQSPKFTMSAILPRYHSSTASYIEFYYLDENYDDMKNKQSVKSKLRSNDKPSILLVENASNIASKLSNFLLFPVKSTVRATTKIPRTSPLLNVPINFHRKRNPQMENLPFLRFKTTVKNFQIPKVAHVFNSNKYGSNLSEYLKKHFLKNDASEKSKLETCPYTTSSTASLPTIETTLQMNLNETNDKETTVYDKIKFFEMFDKNTKANNYKFLNIVNITEKIQLKDVHKDNLPHDGPRNTRYADKPIVQDKPKHKQSGEKKKTFRKFCNNTGCLANLSKTADWKEYSFAAVYVYEPSKVHCDAAGISEHWLVAAASCLSRHQLGDLSTAVLSAFVTFCGNDWEHPVRISYVKVRLIHPRYNPTDMTRRYFYNIGVIKVVNSMVAACSGWAPVPLMSHQYKTSESGATGRAVGWGVDRYVPKNISTEIKKGPLMVYEGQIYSNSCPGNFGYSKAKDLNPNNVKYMYCLSLPPYLGEITDPVHGSLLLVEGKLVALYLQEERRSKGEQSAQYTSIWQQLPWIHDAAREPEIDSFSDLI